MAIDLVALKSEIDTDPLVRGYAGMTDAQVADDMNLMYLPAPADSKALLQYLTLERFRQGTLYGRLKIVANSHVVKDGNAWTIPPVPLGVANAEITITQENVASACSLLRYADVDTQTTVTLLDSRFDTILDDLALGGGCEAIGPADKTAIQALSQNRQSRGTELGLGQIREGYVQQARAL